jgi:hypothetical protein
MLCRNVESSPILNWIMFYLTLQRKSDLCIPRKETARGLSPHFHIHVSVSDLYTPTICPPILLQQNRQTDRGNV